MFFVRKLKKEIEIWQKEKFIEPRQAEILLKYYEKKEQKKGNFSVINILGYFFLGLSLLVFIGHNWEQIPALIRALGLIFLTLMTHIYAFYKLKKDNNSNLFFLANFIYGISIMLIAQAYHLGSYAADAVFWWALGSFFVAIFIGNKWVNIQAFGLSFIWLIMEIYSFYPGYFWIYLAFCGYILYKDEKNTSLFVLFLVLLMYFYAYSLSYFLYDNALKELNRHSFLFLGNSEFAYILTPFVAYFMYLVFTKFTNAYSKVAKQISFFIIYIYSFFLLSSNFLSVILEFYIYREKYYFFSIMLALLIPIFAVTFLLRIRKYYIFTSLVLLLFCSFLFAEKSLFYLSFCLNLAIFCLYSLQVYMGIAQKDFVLYLYGIFGLLVFAMIRYLSLIEDYLSASLLFLLCSVLLLYAARLFKKLSKKEVL